jgi:hypothetical protein
VTDKILELAKEAKLINSHGDVLVTPKYKFGDGCLEAFANLIEAKARADEREQCAKICENLFINNSSVRIASKAFADAIRERGE